MANSPNKLSHFWQELKRRKVIYVITVYASAAFVIIELVNNVVEPLNLPERMSTIVIVVLAIGFPIAIIVSWIFDLTPKGIEKTKSLDEEEESEIPSVQNQWKIATYISIVVIIGLIILNLTGGTSRLKAGDIQSIVILPFENFTGDDQLEYFVSGLHFSLIGDIQKIGGLKVISKTSSDVYRDMDMSVPQIASELNVDVVVEGAVMCLGEDSLCIRFSLITPDEEQIWIADYKEEQSQILNLYSRVTEIIADEVMVELSPEEQETLSRSRIVDREAFDAYLRSQEYWGDFRPEYFENTLNYLQKAIEKEPDWAQPYMALAQYWMWAIQWGYEMPSDAFPRAMENLNRALELDPELPDAHYLKGWIAFVSEWDWEKAENEFLKAIASNPNDANTRIYYAHLMCILQRPREAVAHARLALDLDPLNPTIQILYSTAQIFIDGCEADQSQIDKLLNENPSNFGANHIRNYQAIRCKEYSVALPTEKILLETLLGGKFDENKWKEIEYIYNNQGFPAAYDSIVPMWEDHFNSTTQSPMELAGIYSKANRFDEILDLIEEGYEIRDHTMPYLTTAYDFKPLYDNPRFLSILEELNLPIPNN